MYRAFPRFCEVLFAFVFLCILPLLLSRALFISQVATKMENILFDYSMKNIRTPPRDKYKITLLDKVEGVIKRMRWKAFFFLSPSTKYQQSKINLKSRKCPPPIDELKPFEDDIFDLMDKLKFKSVRNPFQERLKKDIKKINASDKVLVFADKTRNIFGLDKEQLKKLLRENISKSCKKSDEQSVDMVNQELKDITAKHEIGDKIEAMSHEQAFISLKDHKEKFLNNPKCRLINPAKSDLGFVSKTILDRINNSIRPKVNVNHWRNTQSVVERSLTSRINQDVPSSFLT